MFKVGEMVRVISESFGWGHVRPHDVGVVVRIVNGYRPNESRIYVDFPKQEGWAGMNYDFIPFEYTSNQQAKKLMKLHD